MKTNFSIFKVTDMKLKLLAVTVIMLALGLNTAEAQNRSRIQRHRIHQGIRSGELTRGETRGLALQQRRTHRNMRRAYADGVVTRRERKEIRRDKRHNSRAIYRKKHNRRNSI